MATFFFLSKTIGRYMNYQGQLHTESTLGSYGLFKLILDKSGFALLDIYAQIKILTIVLQ